MTKHMKSLWIAGAAALAMAASPAAFAQGNGNGKGGGNGNGNGKGGGPAAASAKPDRGGGKQGNANRGGGNGNAPAAMMRGNAGGNNNAGNANRGGPPVKVRGNGNGNAPAVVRGNNGNNGKGNDLVRVRNRDGVDIDVGFALPDLRRAVVRDNRLIQGCPPGLAKKNNGCLPPGQAKKYRSFDGGLFGFGGGRYFYDDGFLLSFNGDRLSGYIPLLGGALAIGNSWPDFYRPQPLPGYYESYFGLGDPNGYRFADNVIYRVEPESAAILGVAALLTGDDITIGQPMPRGYDVYNVPYAYRERYYDRPDARYRYSDGYVYEIDPETALVVAAIDLVT